MTCNSVAGAFSYGAIMSYGLTRRQSETLDYIRDFIEACGYSPSFGEIAEGLGLKSKSSVYRFVHDLAERGHIIMMPDHRRTIQVVERRPRLRVSP